MEDKVVKESTSLTEIQARIYLVRGVQVMIDRDLALLYSVENPSLRQTVRRNSEKQPEDFLLKLTDEESNNLITRGVSQTVIPRWLQHLRRTRRFSLFVDNSPSNFAK